MTLQTWSLIVSFIAMLLIASSYFLKTKSGFLLFQSLGMIFLMASYLCDGAYFAMVGLGIGLARSLTFFAFEKKDKKAPIFFPILFSAVSVLAYVVINLVILQTARWVDIIYLTGLILYAFIFSIRSLEIMRYTITIPTALSILYNVLSGATAFVVISYTFELGMNLVAIFKYHILAKPTINEKNKTDLQEKKE